MTTGEKFEKVADAVYDKGVIDQRKSFWNTLTNGGKRTNYNNAFVQAQWNKNSFQPTVCIKPTTAASMFNGANGGGQNALGADVYLDDYIAQFGGSFDWAECTNYTNCFNSCTWFKKIKVLDFRKVTSQSGTNNMSAWCAITQVEVMKFAEDGSTPISNTMFTSWTAFGSLGTTSIEGVLGYSINLSSCNDMTVGTMKQIVTHLANYAGTGKEGTCTLTMPSDRWELLEASTSPYEDGLTDNESLSWRDHVAELGWLTV